MAPRLQGAAGHWWFVPRLPIAARGWGTLPATCRGVSRAAQEGYRSQAVATWGPWASPDRGQGVMRTLRYSIQCAACPDLRAQEKSREAAYASANGHLLLGSEHAVNIWDRRLRRYWSWQLQDERLTKVAGAMKHVWDDRKLTEHESHCPVCGGCDHRHYGMFDCTSVFHRLCRKHLGRPPKRGY